MNDLQSESNADDSNDVILTDEAVRIKKLLEAEGATVKIRLPLPQIQWEPVEEGQAVFSVVLMAAGDRKICVIKAVREIIGLSLKESQEVIHTTPRIIKEAVSKKDAEKIKAIFDAEGASVEIQ